MAKTTGQPVIKDVRGGASLFVPISWRGASMTVNSALFLKGVIMDPFMTVCCVVAALCVGYFIGFFVALLG